jgi:hypothetical protein
MGTVTVGGLVVVPQLAVAMVKDPPNAIARNSNNLVVTVAMQFLR